MSYYHVYCVFTNSPYHTCFARCVHSYWILAINVASKILRRWYEIAMSHFMKMLSSKTIRVLHNMIWANKAPLPGCFADLNMNDITQEKEITCCLWDSKGITHIISLRWQVRLSRDWLSDIEDRETVYTPINLVCLTPRLREIFQTTGIRNMGPLLLTWITYIAARVSLGMDK